jgi:AbrB family looped-hinge helix DNA binding protein
MGGRKLWVDDLVRSVNRLTNSVSIMARVKISPKFQVVIPRQVREVLDIAPGQEVEVLVHGGRIEIIPIRPMREMRGFLRGIDTSVEREEDREL